jgi:hypothetical protein
MHSLSLLGEPQSKSALLPYPLAKAALAPILIAKAALLLSLRAALRCAGAVRQFLSQQKYWKSFKVLFTGGGI